MRVDIDNASTALEAAQPGLMSEPVTEGASLLIPHSSEFETWVNAVLNSDNWAALAKREQLSVVDIEDLQTKECELSIRIVGIDEISRLNEDYRNKSGPTNVLSFPAEVHTAIPIMPLGDIVICADKILEESRDQEKTQQAHWAHMVVHGTLHLLGFDHIDDREAQIMESIETQVLASLNIASPY